jgi:DNA recombination protein RmuC
MILEKKSEKFVELNKSKLDQILNPLGEKIEKFEKSVQDKYEKEIEGRASLEEQIKHLKDLNQQISEDAVNLTKALKGDSKTRGDWGELQLEVLLENSGLTKDVHFQMRSTFKDEDGKKTQPDCIIILPDGKNYVIDSKVSLVAYENYVSSEDDAEKEIFLKDHIESIKTHIKELSAKDYSSIHSINPPDYVFMFVPIEPAWFTALGANSDLYTIALEKNIVLVSVTTLLATMRTISFIWQQENQKKNVLEIARQSGALYDKFCNFVSDLEGVGKSMSQSKDKYDEAIKKLSTGKGNLISRSERIKELGAKTKKSLPKELLEKTEMGLLDENTE